MMRFLWFWVLPEDSKQARAHKAAVPGEIAGPR
jgi:hypothetical protein